jgi:hypothetical protein
MEPSGRNRWQAVAKGRAVRTAKTGENRCRGCDPLPPKRHGKEGVDGSSPSEGFEKSPANGMCCCLARRNLRASRVRDGYILGLAGTRGHARRLAAQPETCSRHSITPTHPKSSCKAEVGVACSDATLTPSFAREEVIGIPTTPDLERQPFRPPEVARATLVAHARTLRRRPRPTAHGCAFKRGDVPSRSMHCRAPSR